MVSASTYLTELANALAGEIQNVLADLFGQANVTAVAFDSNGWPSISVGPAGVPTSDNGLSAFLEVQPVTSFPQADSLGLSQNIYTPMQVNIVLEATSSGITGAALTELSASGQVWLWGAVLPFGTLVSLYLIANGSAPAVGGITGSPAQTWGGISQKYPGTSAAV